MSVDDESAKRGPASPFLPLWYGLFFLALLIGLLIGSSESPVVAASFPLFVAILSAAVGWLTSRDPTTPLDSRFLRRSGKAASLLSLGFIAGFFPGTVLRMGQAEYIAIGPWLIDWGSPDPHTMLPEPEDAILLATIDAHLRTLGMQEPSRSKLLLRVAESALLHSNGIARNDITASTNLQDHYARSVLGFTKLADCAASTIEDELERTRRASLFHGLALVSQALADDKPLGACSSFCLLSTVWFVSKASNAQRFVLEEAEAAQSGEEYPDRAVCDLSSDEMISISFVLNVESSTSILERTLSQVEELAAIFRDTSLIDQSESSVGIGTLTPETRRLGHDR